MVTAQQLGYYERDAESAMRQSAPVLETPASVFSINAALMEDQQAFRLDQILQNDSSVQKSNNFLGAYSSYKIRGFELDNATNYLRDGRTFFHLSAPATETLERVEVLKGPASVLYGTLAPGGLINLVSKPAQAERGGFIKATVGTDSLYHIHTDVGGALTDSGKLRARFNGVYERSDSFREFFSGEAFDVRRDVYALALEWDIADSTTLLVNGDYVKDDRPQDNGLIGQDGELLPALDYELIYNQHWTHYNTEVWNVYSLLSHRFNAQWIAKLSINMQSFERDRYDNQLLSFNGNTGENTVLARRRLNQREYITYSLDINANLETGSLEHDLLIGLEKTDLDSDNREPGPGQTLVLMSNVFGPAFPDPGLPIGDVRIEDEETRRGLFVQDMIQVGDHWRLLLGARYDDFETSIGSEYDVDNVSPRLGVLYLFDNDLSVYASYSESFEPNGPVGAEFDNAGEDLDPTTGEMIELGAKWELYAGNLLLTSAVFTIERDGDPIVDPMANEIQQRGLSEHAGLELTAAGLIGDSLSLTSSFTYLDAEIKRDEDPNLEGNTPFGVSKYAYSLWGEYQFNRGLLQGLSLQAGVFYESSRPVDDVNSFNLDSYTRLDLGAKYLLELDNGHLVTTRLTVSNLTNEEYYKAQFAFAMAPERLREIRGSIQYSF